MQPRRHWRRSALAGREPDRRERAAQDAIKVGVIQPLTGAFAASGNYVANGAKIAADEINAKGGVLGKKLELVIEDNKSNPTERPRSPRS